jgi:hypothetical protein
LAKVKNPDLARIDRLGPDIDFYYWKGIPVIRKMPKKVKPIGTEAQKETWAAMKYAHEEYKKLPTLEREAYKFLTRQSQMCNRDFVTKLCLKNYQDFGEKYSSWRVSFEPQGGGVTKVLVNKAYPSNDIVSCMTYNESVDLLRWLEITPNLRGKKFRRRWDLSEKIGDSHNSFTKTAIGGECSLLDVYTSVNQPVGVKFRGNELFVADQKEGLKAFNIIADSLVFADLFFDGTSPTSLGLIRDYILLGKYNGGFQSFTFNGVSLNLEYTDPAAPTVFRIAVDDDLIYTCEAYDGVGVYSISMGVFTEEARLPPYIVRTSSVALCGSYVVTTEANHSILLYTFEDGDFELVDSYYYGVYCSVWADDSYILVKTLNGVYDVFSVVGGKLKKLTGRDYGNQVYGLFPMSPYFAVVMDDGFFDFSFFNGNELLTAFSSPLGLPGRLCDMTSNRFAVTCYKGSIRYYSYSLQSPFGYEFLANKANGDDFLCIKSDPEDSSSFGLSGLYSIPY